MSINIDKSKCVGCKKCLENCPGNLIKLDENKKAYIKYPKDCWGCTSCIKECSVCAIQFYLGADIGGRGSKLTVKHQGDLAIWQVEKTDGTIERIEVDTKASNQY